MLKGKTILITGSSSGIGAATARLAKEYGATPILHGKTDSEDLKKIAKELSCEYIVCDVADKTAVDSEVKRIVEKVKKIDALVNCAGIVLDESFLESSDEVWLEIIKINLLGTVHFSQATIPFMQKNSYGRIVNIASIRGHESTSSNARMSYSVSKAAIVNLTSSLAKEYAPNIAVNAVSPGFINTNIAKSWTEKVKKQAQTALVGRIGEPKEIAEMILFLASDRASFITGQTFIVDGGYSISGK